MIRQAISCDICGTEKRQTNHWFVAFEQAGELRLGGWTSRNRARPNSKHLCGQTCVHKLVDEYMAQIVASKPLRAIDDSIDDSIEYQDQTIPSQPVVASRPARQEPITTPAPRPTPLRAQQPAARDHHDDRSLTTEYDFNLDDECSTRLIPTPDPEPAIAHRRPTAEAQPLMHTAPSRPALVAAPKPTDHSIIELPLADQAPSFSSRKWRTEAWERERARELRAANNTPASIVSRLRLN